MTFAVAVASANYLATYLSGKQNKKSPAHDWYKLYDYKKALRFDACMIMIKFKIALYKRKQSIYIC